MVKKAADKGEAAAMTFIANMYGNGEGVSKDYSQAMLWYKKAADKGNEDAKSALKRIRM